MERGLEKPLFDDLITYLLPNRIYLYVIVYSVWEFYYMKNSFSFCQFAGFIFTSVMGTLYFINIAIFFLAVAFTYILETRLLKQGKVPCRFPKAAMALLLVIAVAFVVFTFNPPGIPLFKEPS